MKAKWRIDVVVFARPWAWSAGLAKTSDWHRVAWLGPLLVEWWREPVR